MAKRVRWECPNGCGAKLGSTRPPRDAAVRYCLRCTERTGQLVERVAPVLERKRAARTVRRQEREQAKRERIRQDPKEKIRRLFQRWRKLKAWDRGGRPLHASIEVRQRRGSRTSGRAYFHSGRIVLTIGTDFAEAQAILLHELAHVAGPYGLEGHGPRWRARYTEAAREVLCYDVPPPVNDSAAALDDAVIATFREVADG